MDPDKRATARECLQHPWLTSGFGKFSEDHRERRRQHSEVITKADMDTSSDSQEREAIRKKDDDDNNNDDDDDNDSEDYKAEWNARK